MQSDRSVEKRGAKFPFLHTLKKKAFGAVENGTHRKMFD